MLNQAVRRNAARFPADFVFRLNRSERDEVITICDHLVRLKFSPSLPFALDNLEAKYDRQFKVVFDAIREMMSEPAVPKRRRIGFIQND